MENYKDPKDLRAIPLERLQLEGKQKAHQFRQWNDLFDIESAIRVSNRDKDARLSEVNKWSILSNRYLLMEREHLSDFKLFTKDEVLKMIEDAYYEGYNDCEYNGKDGTKDDLVRGFVEKKKVEL